MAVLSPSRPKVPFPKKERIEAPIQGAAPQPHQPALARIIRPEAAFRWTGNYVQSYTPQYVETILRAALGGDHVRAWELFDLMEDTWPRLRKNMMEIKSAVGNLNQVYSAACEEDEEPTPAAAERKKIVSAALRSMRPDPTTDECGLDDIIFDILDARFKGISVLELDWQMIDGGSLGSIVAPRAGWWVHPSCYGWTNGRLGLVDPRTDFPPDKFIVAQSRTKTGSPLGGALLRPLAWWWCAANFSADWLLNLAQIFGLPFRWATYETNASEETVAAISTMLANMGSAGWAAFPAGTTLELKAEGQKSGDATPQGNMLDRADTQCDLLILGQTLTTRMDSSGGSQAAATIHEGVKYENVMAAAGFVEEVFEDQLFPMILRHNYGEESECPLLSLESEDEGDMVKDATVIAALSKAGAGKIIGLEWIGKRFRIPKPGKDEETLGGEKNEEPDPQVGKGVKEEGSGPETEKDIAEELKAISAITDDEAFQAALKDFSKKL